MPYDQGSVVVECLKPGGDTLVLYGVTATQGQQIDLMDLAAPVGIRCSTFETARNIVSDPGFELGAKVKAGLWRIVSMRPEEII
jgi:hypothetical protein